MVVLGVTVLVATPLARRLRVAAPIVLLAIGAALGFVPALREVELPPEVVLLLFLPAILYWESLTTSLREIRANLRGVVLSGTLLVVLTAAAVATGVHALGVAWGPAWVLGAAVAPTDATAMSALARGLPRRSLTTLRAESLINDGTALVLLALAIGAVAEDMRIEPLEVSGLVALSYGGGIGIGFAVAGLASLLRRRIDDALQENVVTVLTPFTAYLLAETIGSSGVLAVVVCGLIMSQTGPRIGRADTRAQTTAVWSLTTHLLNGSLFVLVGIEMQRSVRALSGPVLLQGLLGVAVVTAVLVAVRFAFLFGIAGLVRLLDRRPPEQALRLSDRARTVNATAGFRGAVSLAAALSVPMSTSIESGGAFPDRDLIVFVTAGVIAVTLIGQGIALPIVVRWARLPPDDDVDREREEAERTATEEVLDALPELARQVGADETIVERTRQELQTMLGELRDEAEGRETEHGYEVLRLAVIRRKREVVLRLRDERRIDDIVLRGVQARLDIEEIRLTGATGVD